MPFFLQSGLKRRKKQLAVYHLPPSLGLEEWWSAPQTPDKRGVTTTATTPDTLPDMGRRSQKPPPGTPCDSRDIGSMLQRQAIAKMAALDVHMAVIAPQTLIQEVAQPQPQQQISEQTAQKLPRLLTPGN
ncbi:Hypothetical predicted protein [Pelobates cultripes]|uniref:Uncharacterized protein n=1 Tax=Pelobates cultripes TaxID=61616 RepID=A0AAD1VR69_PELCU|nr:Hypothetical predicted protein [Pelobates cultripes]